MKSITLGRAGWYDWLFVIFGGLPFILPTLLLVDTSKIEVATGMYWVNVAITSPHLFSSYSRLQRKIGEGNVSFSLGLPSYALWCALFTTAFLNGHGRLLVDAVLFMQSFHYLRQVYGVFRIYGSYPEESELGRRVCFLGFHMAIPLFVIGRWDSMSRAANYSQEHYTAVRFPDMLMYGLWMLAAIGVLFAIYGEIERWKSQKTLHVTPFVILVLFYVIHWYCFLRPTSWIDGFYIITLFHAIQYLSVVWMAESKYSRGWPQRILGWMPIGYNFFGFWLVMAAVAWSITNGLLLPVAAYWAPLYLIIFNSLSAHHYVVDAVIWRRDVKP
jgi:hypothetical protein